MTNVEMIYRDFWKTFDEILIENGEPFQIIHTMSGKERSWANVNRVRAMNNNAVDLSLQSKRERFRIDFYIYDKNNEIGQIMSSNKDKINSEISVALQWKSGDKNPNTLRVQYFISYANCSYREAIEKALPIIMEFIAVANKYGRNYFFDF